MSYLHTEFSGKTVRQVIASRPDETGLSQNLLLAFTDGKEIMLGATKEGYLVSSPVVDSGPQAQP